MSYNFAAPITDNAGPIQDNTATSAISRWNTKKGETTDMNAVFHLGSDATKRFHAQKMKSAWVHAFLKQLHTADPLTNDVKIVVRMAVGSADNVRPLIGFSTQSNQKIDTEFSGDYWTFQLNVTEHNGQLFVGPDGDDGHEMVPGTASQYHETWANADKDKLFEQVSYVPGNGSRTYVNLFIFDNDAVKQIYNHAKAGTNGKVEMYLFLGSAAEDPDRDEGSHPMHFRPILDLRRTDDSNTASGSHFWDFSTPCPPNCNSRQ